MVLLPLLLNIDQWEDPPLLGSNSANVDLISVNASFGAGGEQVLSFAGLGQVTGVLVWICEDGNTDDATVTIGAAGANGSFVDTQYMCGITARDGASPTVAWSVAESGGIGGVINPADGTVDHKLSVNTFGENKVNCTWDDDPGPTVYRIVALGFGGSANTQVGSVTCSGTKDAAVTESMDKLAWKQPELLVCFGTQSALDVAPTADGHLAMGFATTANGSSISQAGHDMQIKDSLITTSPGQLMKDPASGTPRVLDFARHNGGAADISSIEITAMTQGSAGSAASSFEVTTRDLGSSFEFGYICIATGGAEQFELADISLAEQASGGSITGLTVTPDHMIMLLSGINYTELDTETMGTAPAGTRAFSLTDGTSSYCINVLDRNNQSLSDTRTRYQPQFIYCDKHAGGSGLRGTLDSLDDNGFTYTTTSWIGTEDKQALVLVIGEAEAVPVQGQTGRGEVQAAGSVEDMVRHAGSVQSEVQHAGQNMSLVRAASSVRSSARHAGSEASEIKGA